MPECHKCPWNMEKNNNCFDCKGPTKHLNKKGLSFVSLETIPQKELFSLTIPRTNPESKMAAFMRHWMYLPPKTQSLISLAISGQFKSCATLARMAGRSRQQTHLTLLKTAKEFPELRSILRSYLRKLRKIAKTM